MSLFLSKTCSKIISSSMTLTLNPIVNMTMSAPKLNFCPNLSFLFQHHENILDRYTSVEATGLFTGVEIGQNVYDVPAELIKAKLTSTSTKLQQILINSHPGNLKGDGGLAAIPGREEDFLNAAKISIEYANVLNCKRIHFMSGVLRGQENSPEVLKTLEGNLRRILPDLEKHGITGLIEPINNETVEGYVLSDYDKAISIVKSINSPNIRLQLDFFHLQKIEGNLTKRLDQCFPLIGHIQIAQVPLRNEPHLPGELDYSYIFQYLQTKGYKGWIGLEYKSVYEGPDCVKGIKEWVEKFNLKL